MGDWREPTADERELLRVILLADFLERSVPRECLIPSRVRLSCMCGCGSLEFESAPPESMANHWEFELDGLTGSGDRVVVALRRRGEGGPVLLEIVGLEHHVPLSEVVPESLRQSDVARVERGVEYRVPRALTVLEEASRAE